MDQFLSSLHAEFTMLLSAMRSSLQLELTSMSFESDCHELVKLINAVPPSILGMTDLLLFRQSLVTKQKYRTHFYEYSSEKSSEVWSELSISSRTSLTLPPLSCSPSGLLSSQILSLLCLSLSPDLPHLIAMKSMVSRLQIYAALCPSLLPMRPEAQYHAYSSTAAVSDSYLPCKSSRYNKILTF
ncbi:hypothetical protein F2Q68_00014922 [Brassica cretica]|uniref:RNase H type-1 domain-containing protein n=1 Tax=Brassica cretica TaxID=69181 RepID=A0A8S9H842_BRACR|nr:hypothetical protein F2Q68_00014922 [Brassica cretica]